MQKTYDENSEAVRYLLDADPVLAEVIRAVGTISVALRPDPFTALARGIVGQQLSVKAARSIWSRVQTVVGPITPETFLAVDPALLSAAGLSRAKVAYIRGLAGEAAAGGLERDSLLTLDDAEAMLRLTRLRGVGRWTAEMFLIFSLGREDVFAIDDAGLRRGLRLFYGENVMGDADYLAAILERWQPYRSVASLYLWAALDGGVSPG